MKKMTTTKPVSSRFLWQQCFKDALQRLTVTLMLVMLTTAVAWADELQDGKWKYIKSNDSQAWITGNTIVDKTAETVLTIPETFEHGAVRVVGFSGFTLEAFTNLTRLELPASTDITAIPEDFARGLTQLSVVDVAGNSSTNRQLPAAITTIGAHAFAGTAIYKLIMPSVTAVGEGAFQRCNSLKHITFGQAATIGDDAFADCHYATPWKITYPGPTSNWSYRAYRRSPQLYVFCYDAQGNETGACGWAGDTGTENCVYWTRDAAGSVTFACDDAEAYSQHPNEQAILNYNWRGNSDLSVYTMRNLTMRNVYTTGKWHYIKTIETVTLQEGVTVIDQYAFENITTLTTVSMTADVNTISAGAFLGCTGLKDVWYEGSLTQWDDVGKADTWKREDVYHDLDFTVHYRCTLTFNMQGHGTAPASQRVYSGVANVLTAPAENPTAQGWTFGGWYSNAACTEEFDFTAAVSDNVTAYAKWTALPQAITFDMKGKGEAVVSQNIMAGETVSEPAQQFVTDGGTLWGIDAWCTDEACTKEFDFATPVDHSFTLYARWQAAATAVINIHDATEGCSLSLTDAKGRAVDNNGHLIAGTCTLTVTPASGYSFEGSYTLTDRSSGVSESAQTLKGNATISRQIDLTTKDVDITVTFSTNPVVSVTVSTDGIAEAGTYTMQDGHNKTYVDGDDVTAYGDASQPADAITLTIKGCALTIVNNGQKSQRTTDTSNYGFTPHGNVTIELFFYDTTSGMIELANDADNSTALTTADGKKRMVTLSGRTLKRDGNWNTLCLPFDFDITGSVLDKTGMTLKELDTETADNGHLTGLEGSTLYLNFKSAGTQIKAGKPYIIKWTKPSSYNSSKDITDPVFGAVTIDNSSPESVTSADGNVTFAGQYSPFSIVESGATGDNQGNINEILLLAAGNKLGYSQNPRTLHSFRCHFYVPTNGTTAAHSFVVDFGEGETTEIETITNNQYPETITNNQYPITDGAWYTIDGRKLTGKPTAKGIYIVNGKKVIVK